MQPQNQTVNEGLKATFDVDAVGGVEPLHYQWYKIQNGSTTPVGSDSHSYTTPVNSLADNGSKFYVTVTDSATPTTSVSSDQSTLTVNATAIPINEDVVKSKISPILLNQTSTDSHSDESGLSIVSQKAKRSEGNRGWTHYCQV